MTLTVTVSFRGIGPARSAVTTTLSPVVMLADRRSIGPPSPFLSSHTEVLAGTASEEVPDEKGGFWSAPPWPPSDPPQPESSTRTSAANENPPQGFTLGTVVLFRAQEDRHLDLRHRRRQQRDRHPVQLTRGRPCDLPKTGSSWTQDRTCVTLFFTVNDDTNSAVAVLPPEGVPVSRTRSVALLSGAALLAAVLAAPPAMADRYIETMQPATWR